MTIHMKYRVGRDGDWVDFDLAANGAAVTRLRHSYGGASRLDWTVAAPEQSAPIPRAAWVVMWDDVGEDPDENPLTESNPNFFGIIAEVNPGSHSNEVVYVAFDPSYFAAKSIPVMSLPYGVDGVPDPDAIPRLVYNVWNDADDDYAYSVGQGLTVGQILAGLLDFTLTALQAIDAAGTDAYDPDDLADMDFQPQSKVVFDSTTIRSAIEQIYRHEPRYRFFWRPDSKLWRFIKLFESETVTLSLNDNGLVNEYPLIAADIKSQYQDCITAVSITGPQKVGSAEFYWEPGIDSFSADDTNLVPVGSPVTVENYSDAGGMQTAEMWQEFQIFDETQRAGSKMLADWTTVPEGTFARATRFPTFLASWDGGTTWFAVKGAVFNYLTGTVRFPGNIVPYITYLNFNVPISPDPASTQTKFPPNALKLVWGPYEPSLRVRYPETGHSGTAYTVYGWQNEAMLQDDSLAIGREYGVPVTNTERLEQFVKLAQYLQEVRGDIVFTGSAVLSGCDYSWCRMDRRVNIDDAAGSETGWEEMAAIVTDVEYVYGDSPSTNLTFNANWLEMYGEDTAALRERLRIRSFDQSSYYAAFGKFIESLQFRVEENYNGSKSLVISGANVQNPFVYVDQFGNIQQGSIR